MVDTNVSRVLSRVFEVEPSGPSGVEAMAESVIPEGAAWAWGQALMDLGATVCRASQPPCLICPLLAECGGPRPRSRREVHHRKPAEEFRASNRYVRGRILDALRDLPPGERVTRAALADRVGGRAYEMVDALAAEGLVAVDADGQVQLPQ
jgi:A/G-specific adenine glycosylase